MSKRVAELPVLAATDVDGSTDLVYVVKPSLDITGDRKMTLDGLAAAMRIGLTVNTWAELAALDMTGMPANTWVRVAGRAAAGDGGEGHFWYDPVSAVAAINGMVFTPAAGGGRLLRFYDPVINVRWFGATGDGSANDAPAVQAAIDFADNPTYAWAGAASLPNGSALSVFCPAGRYRLAAVVNLKSTEFFGKFSGNGDWNQGTVFQIDHGSHGFVFDAATANPPSHWHDFWIFGRWETNQQNKKSITSVTNRTRFFVATGDVPTHSPEAVWPYYGFCFFFDQYGRYLGSGAVQTVNAGTGQIDLATDWDNYATPTAGAGVLTTACKVVFGGVTASEGGYTNFPDPSSALACAIYTKNSGAGVVNLPEMNRISISSAPIGIRVAPASLNGNFGTLRIVHCLFAGILLPKSTSTTDNYYSNVYISGKYIPEYGGTSGTYDNGALRNCAFGIFGVGPLEHYLGRTLIEFCTMGMVIFDTLQQGIQTLFFDGCARHALVIRQGYNGGTVFSTFVVIGSMSARSPLTAGDRDTLHTDQTAIKVLGVDATKPVKVGISQLILGDGGTGKFAYGFDIPTASAHKIRVAELTDLVGATAVFNTANRAPEVELYASGTWDPPNLAAGANTTTTITVNGARAGDLVRVSLSTLTTQVMTLTGVVSANDTVQVVLANLSGGAIDLASGTLRVVVEKRA